MSAWPWLSASALPEPRPCFTEEVFWNAFDSVDKNTHTQLCATASTPANASNLKKHGFDLADAQRVIESGATVTFEDRRFDYDEERFVTLGPLGDILVAIVSAESDDHIRIISMRKAVSHEQAIYRENLC